MLILLRFFFLASSTLFSFLLNESRSITRPVFLGPVNLAYLVVIVSSTSLLSSPSETLPFAFSSPFGASVGASTFDVDLISGFASDSTFTDASEE